MPPSPRQHKILRAAAAFASIRRYHGMLPQRLTLLYDTGDLETLEATGLLERRTIELACGKGVTGWRLTAAGYATLPEPTGGENTLLAPEHLRLLNDFYHYSQISGFRGMMPKKMAKRYDADDVRDLFERGYLLRVRISGAHTGKGWLVSHKGLASLEQATKRPQGIPCP